MRVLRANSEHIPQADIQCRGKQYELRHTRADSSLSLPLSLSHSFFSPFVLLLLLLLLSTALFSSLPTLLSLSVLHLLSESLVLSVFTLSPCSPVSTNPTCVCTSPGLSLWLQATLHCLFYFKSLDRHTAQIKMLNHCSFFFCMLCL